MADFEVHPAGTWDWLAHLGYSRSDVERIVKQRQNSIPAWLKAARQEFVEHCRALQRDLAFRQQRSDEFQTMLEAMTPFDLSGPKAAAIDQGIYDESGLIVGSAAPRADRRCGMWDAEPMSKDEIVRRRDEGAFIHFVWGNGNPYYIPRAGDPLHELVPK